MKKLLLLLLIVAAGCVDQGIGPREEAQDIYEGELDADIISLDIETFNGFIEVQFWDKETMQVQVVKWARGDSAREKVQNMEVQYSSNEGEITVNIPSIMNAGADITVYLPQKSVDTIALTTSNHHIVLEEVIANKISLKTSNGSINAYVTANIIEAITSNGSVKGFFKGKRVSIDTSNAKIGIDIGSSGDYDLKTSNADIDISVDGDFGFDLSTSNGYIKVENGEIVYALTGKTHKKGFTAEDAQIFVTASTSNANIIIGKK
ncbi:MAG: hypothetical protein PVF58_01470 [Candidatus Methanofastidiosia archaeon]|jgi:DUF4097 and DUF4098 domain-containing protein YvlB